MFDASKAQFNQAELAMAADVAEIVEVAKNLKGTDGKLDAGDFLAVAGITPKVVALIEYISKGAEGPEDDAMVAARGISVFAAYGRGSGLLEMIPGPAPKV